MKSILKNANRLIQKTRGRFLSLTAIVALGTAFFIGVSAISTVMSASVNEYDDKLNLKDITIYSNYGFDKDDVKAVNEMECVELAEGAKFVDTFVTDSEDYVVTRIHGYREDTVINQFVLREGRMPENNHEVLADGGNKIRPGFSLGTQLYIKRPDDDLSDYLNTSQVTVVGIIDSPLYLSSTRESSTLSNQQIRTYLYIPEDAFATDYYTEMNVLIKDGKSYDEFSEEYLDYAKSIKDEITTLSADQVGSRRQKLQDEAMEEYNDGVEKYEDGLKEYQDGLSEYNRGVVEYYSEIAKAEKQLADAETEISDGWTQIREGEEKLVSAQQELDQARIDYTKQIEDGKAQLADGWKQLEDGKKEFAAKEQEYLAMRAQLTSALEQINAPMLDRNAKLSYFMKDLCEEGQELIRCILRYFGADPETVTVGDIADYLNTNFNDATIAAMNQRIDEVIQSNDFIEYLQEDSEVEMDPEELIKLIQAGKENLLAEADEKMDTDKEMSDDENESDELKEGSEIASEDLDNEEKEENDIDQSVEEADITEDNYTETAPAEQPIVIPEEPSGNQQEEYQEPVTEEPVISEPEETEPEAEPILEETEAVEEPGEQPVTEEPDEESVLTEMALNEEDLEIQPHLLMDTETDTSSEKTIAVDHSIKTFDELITAMGDSDPTFSQLMKFTVWPYMSVDCGVRILNTKARILQNSGGILEVVMNTAIPDGVTIGTVALLNPDITKLRDQFGLTDSSTIGEVRTLLSSSISQIDSGLAEGRAKIADSEQYLNEMSAKLSQAEAELNQKLTDGQNEINQGWAEIESNKQKLYDARIALNEGYSELNRQKANGIKKLQDARAELDQAWSDLEEGKAELADAKEQIDSMEAAEWTYLDRSQHYASETYRQTIQQMSAIAKIFPVFFIAVAALVCLTTMTRMVNEERGQIGIFRALGFSNMQCEFTYLYYAGLASVVGSVFGSVVGLATFPVIIYNTWKMLYILPKMKMVIPWDYVFGSTVIFLAMMEGVTAYVLHGDMVEVPAAVMRPKAPKVGKGILLEKISIIWNHLSFSWKVTIRNLMRYKKRVAMTILGVAGCSALLVTGFGISDSINDIVQLQFYEIDKTDAIIELSSEASTPTERNRVIREIEEIKDTEKVFSGINYTGKVVNVSDQEEVAYTQVFRNDEAMHEIYNVRERISKDELHLEKGSVIISEKMSETMHIGIGDTITIESYDGSKAKVPVSGIMEMYVYHYVMMGEDTYQELFGTLPEANALFLSVNSSKSSDYIQRVSEIDGVDSVEFTENIMDNFNKMISGINGVVYVLVLSSMALAFVVLGNLTNVNISERLREIATIKVLGFRKKEVENYIYKENNVLVAAGAVIGLLPGAVLHRYIMHEVELSNVMYGRSERPLTFVYAFVLTIVFGLLVNFIMRKKLSQIEMVESLKSVE